MFRNYVVTAVRHGAQHKRFGLAAFTAQRRTREIGVRKVFGARTTDLMRLLLGHFSLPVRVANIIAWPVAYDYLNDWLQSYTYRIPLNPVYFIAAGGIALLIAWLTVLSHDLRVARKLYPRNCYE